MRARAVPVVGDACHIGDESGPRGPRSLRRFHCWRCLCASASLTPQTPHGLWFSGLRRRGLFRHGPRAGTTRRLHTTHTGRPCLRTSRVGCGVCDTPELWRGAAGQCARVRVCVRACDVLVPRRIFTSYRTHAHTIEQLTSRP